MSHEQHEPIDRRTAIKKGVVGAAAAGVAWSAPRIEGLSLRPNYAAASSAGPINGNVAATFTSGTGAVSSTQSCPGGGTIMVIGTRALPNVAGWNYTAVDAPGCDVTPTGYDVMPASAWAPFTGSTPGKVGTTQTMIAQVDSPPDPTVTVHYTCS